MKRYLLKATLTATENNKEFVGGKFVIYYGKRNIMFFSPDAITIEVLEKHGYKTEKGVTKNFWYSSRYDKGLWNVTREIVEFALP